MTKELYKTTFPALTGFRFVSALLVFIFHYNPFSPNSFLWGICNELYVGVGMFFVLSGFLITYNYYNRVTQGSQFFKTYFLKRFARIYPVYFLISSLYFGYHLFKHPLNNFLVELFLNLSLLKGFSEKYFLSGIVQAWSLTTEECFYLSAPFIFWFIRLKKVLWLQAVALALFGIGMVLIFEHFPQLPLFESLHFMFIATFFGRCVEFFAGIQFALWLKRKEAPTAFMGKRKTVVGVLLICFCVVTMNFIRQVYNVDHATSQPVGLLLNNVFLAFSVAVLLDGLVHEKTYLSDLLSSKVLVILGKSSYVFYLIHAGLFADYLTKYTYNNLLLKFVALQIIALVLFYFVEKPMNHIIRNKFARSEVYS